MSQHTTRIKIYFYNTTLTATYNNVTKKGSPDAPDEPDEPEEPSLPSPDEPPLPSPDAHYRCFYCSLNLCHHLH